MAEPLQDLGGDPLSPAEAEVLEALRRRVRTLDPVVLRFLRNQGWIADAVDDGKQVGIGEALDGLVARYKEAADLRGAPTVPSERRVLAQASGDDLRGEALARIFAADAGKDPMVKAYRARYLPAGIIASEEVPAWVRSRRAIGLRATRGDGAPAGPAAAALHQDAIAYLVPGSPHPELAVIAGTGALHELKTLATRLTGRYGWVEAQAVGFVLSGLPPWLPTIRAITVERMPWTAASVIELEISPRASPREVASVYAAVRARMIGPDRRRRDLQRTERADLAVFAFERFDERPWREVMVEWNATAPEPHRRYDDARSFARDCTEAFGAVTGASLG